MPEYVDLPIYHDELASALGFTASDLDANRETLAEQHATAGHNDNDVSGVQRGIGRCLDKLGVAADSLNKHTFQHKGLLQIGDPTIRKNVGKAIGPVIPLPVA